MPLFVSNVNPASLITGYIFNLATSRLTKKLELLYLEKRKDLFNQLKQKDIDADMLKELQEKSEKLAKGLKNIDLSKKKDLYNLFAQNIPYLIYEQSDLNKNFFVLTNNSAEVSIDSETQREEDLHEFRPLKELEKDLKISDIFNFNNICNSSKEYSSKNGFLKYSKEKISSLSNMRGQFNRKVLSKNIRVIDPKYYWIGNRIEKDGKGFNIVVNPAYYTIKYLTQINHSFDIVSKDQQNKQLKKDEHFLIDFHNSFIIPILPFILKETKEIKDLENKYEIQVTKIQKKKHGNLLVYIFTTNEYTLKAYYSKETGLMRKNFQNYLHFLKKSLTQTAKSIVNRRLNPNCSLLNSGSSDPFLCTSSLPSTTITNRNTLTSRWLGFENDINTSISNHEPTRRNSR